MLIDFHTHVFPEKIAQKTLQVLKNNVFGVRGEYPPVYTDGTTRGLKMSMEKSGVDISVVMPIATSPRQTPTINSYAKEITDGTIVSFGSLHPEQEDAVDVLEQLAQQGFRGIKLHPQYQGVFADDPRVIKIVERAEKLGLYTLFHAGVDVGVPESELSTPKRLKRLLDYVSGEYIIAAHLGGFEMWDMVEKYLVGTKMYFDISYACSYIDKKQFKRIVDNHGAKKILYASDSPWDDQKKPLEALCELKLAKEEMDLITHKNAMNILGI